MAITTWSTTDLQQITLSNGNLTATGNAGTCCVRSIYQIPRSTKTYWEYTAGTIHVNSDWYGVTDAAASLGDGSGNASSGWVQSGGSGTIYIAGAGAGINLGNVASGTVICVALQTVSTVTCQVWFRLGAAGNWNGSSSNDPAAGTGGQVFNCTTPCAAFFTNTSGDAVTANFGNSAFVGTVPAGFTGALGTPTTAQLTQIAAEQWASGTPQAQLTQVALEQWAAVSTTNPQAVLTQIALEQWASVTAAASQQQWAFVLA